MAQNENRPALGSDRAGNGDHSGEQVNLPNSATDAAAQLPLTVTEWPKGRDTIRVRLDSFNGHQTIDVRAWWTNEAGELRPGRSGITVGIAHLPRLADALGQAVAEARRLGLIEEDGGGR